MSYDMCARKGNRLDLSVICTLCERCKRYVIGKMAIECGFPAMLWTKPQYKDGKCELFIEVKEEQQ